MYRLLNRLWIKSANAESNDCIVIVSFQYENMEVSRVLFRTSRSLDLQLHRSVERQM